MASLLNEIEPPNAIFGTRFELVKRIWQEATAKPVKRATGKRRAVWIWPERCNPWAIQACANPSQPVAYFTGFLGLLRGVEVRELII